MSRLLRLVLGLLLASYSALAPAQDGWAYRTGLGTPLGAGADGVPRYREDVGWSTTNYTQARWGVEYDTALSASPWTAVHQADRTNAAFTAAANKLTLDLNGGTYTLRPYLVSGNTVKGGKLNVFDRDGTGASLKITNGTFHNNVNSNSVTTVGANGLTGRLVVEQGLLNSYITLVGNGSNTTGSLTLEDGGKLISFDRLAIGNSGTGSIELRGAGSSITSGTILIGDAVGRGSLTLNHADASVQVSASNSGNGDVQVRNVNPAQPGTNIGLRMIDGTLSIERDLLLAGADREFGAALLEGGTVRVGNTVFMGNSTSETNGGKLFLQGGRLEITTPDALRPAPLKNVYWKTGTLAFTGAIATLTDVRLADYTRQGALSYGGERATGALAAGQNLDAAGQLILSSPTNGPIKLAGGTIRAGDGLVLNTGIEGYGTLDAVVSGPAAITNTTGNALSVGALGGSNAIVSTGELRVGGRSIDASYSGTSSGTGAFAKVGMGTQTITGRVSNSAVDVRQGGLVFDGAGLRLETGSLAVADTAGARFTSGATGTVSGDVANAGWIELAGGTLDVGGTFVNHGRLINNGTLNADVTGSGLVTGAGTFGDSVTIAGGSILAPGNSPGSASFNDLTLGSGGVFELELVAATGSAGAEWDLASVGGLLSMTATAANPYLVLLKSLDASFAAGALADFDPTQPYSWKFVSATIADPGAVDLTAFQIDTVGFSGRDGLGDGTFTMAAATDGLSVEFAPVSAPEPGSVMLLLIAGVAAGGERLRRRACRRPDADGSSLRQEQLGR